MTTSPAERTIAPLGFGCAQLFRLHSASERARVLSAAYDAGIRHFDVAPLYGLGLAEDELGRFLGSRRDTVTVTTKFGLDPTVSASVLRSVQGMIRQMVTAMPPVQRYLQRRRRPLARGQSFDAKVAEHSLERSLRLLRVDFLDYFLLHEPTVSLVARDQPMDFLERQRDRGRIRAFGVAGPLDSISGVIERFPSLASVIQHPAPPLGSCPVDLPCQPTVAHFIYGSIASRMTGVRAILEGSAADNEAWLVRFGQYGNGWRQEVARLLLIEQRLASPSTTILFGSTDPGHVREMARQPSTRDLDAAAWVRDWAVNTSKQVR